MPEIYVVDAFAEGPFKGNPAAVCLLPDGLDDEKWMQSVASEMNLSDTAFVSRRGEDWDLRWFTPLREVDLCGHATLASAHVLFEGGFLREGRAARFHTKSGALAVSKKGDLLEMDFPAEPAKAVEPPEALAEALGVGPVYTGRNRFDILAVLSSEDEVRGLAPDLALLKRLETRGVIVTARSKSAEYDFVSRFFAPAYGIDEDPVTGSAHCCLAPYWAEKTGKAELAGYQASRRGGMVWTRVSGERVFLSGGCVTVLKGELKA